MKSKNRKCSQCKTKGAIESGIVSGLQWFCGEPCRAMFNLAKFEKDRDKILSKAKKLAKTESRSAVLQLRLKDKSYRKKQAQAAFNAYIRERDRAEPCISCGRHHQGQYHAGHYRTVGAHPELRFNELNCHKQCSVCNNHKSGNIAEYRISLIKKIGIDMVDWLEGKHEPMKYSCDDLLAIEQEYKLKLKELKCQ